MLKLAQIKLWIRLKASLLASARWTAEAKVPRKEYRFRSKTRSICGTSRELASDDRIRPARAYASDDSRHLRLNALGFTKRILCTE